MAEALETRIAGLAATVPRMQVTAMGIALPDLDACLTDGVAALIEDAPAKIRDLPPRHIGMPLDPRQVSILIQRDLGGIERPGGLARGGHARGQCRQRGGTQRSKQEFAAGRVHGDPLGRDDFLRA